MNEHPAPLEPEPLDELLSAELDGEFAAAARDLGLSVDEATARLRDAERRRSPRRSPCRATFSA